MSVRRSFSIGIMVANCALKKFIFRQSLSAVALPRSTSISSTLDRNVSHRTSAI